MADEALTRLHFCIIEDSAPVAELTKRLLETDGHTVNTFGDAEKALPKITELKPDVVITDIMMPGMDGYEVCERLNKDPALRHTKIIVLSGKAYDFDRERMRKLGATAFFTKPVDPATFTKQIMRAISDAVTVRYWGVRGTLPVPGPHSLRYGGNTNCVSMEFPLQRNFIFDAGTGIRELGNDILSRRKGKWSGKIFISHPHWDHINAFPFFTPLYIPGNEFEILGANQGSKSIRELISAQMDDVYFPITLKEMGARIFFRDIGEETLDVDGIEVMCMTLSHPGKCIGFRVNYDGKSFCYITDNEIYPQDSEFNNPEFEDNLMAFIAGADIALMDTCYLDEEYRRRVNWGHSSVSEVVRIAHGAGVKELQLYHHDPDQTDDQIDRKLQIAQDQLAKLGSSTVCTAPVEGTSRTL